MSKFAGRIALVTGGGRGIGQGISLALAAEGAIVAVNYAKDANAAQDTVAQIVAAGGVAKERSITVGRVGAAEGSPASDRRRENRTKKWNCRQQSGCGCSSKSGLENNARA